MFDIDTGSGDGAKGPFLAWNASESKDGRFPGRSWVMRDSEGKSAFDGMSRGVVMDIENLKTGWCWSDGSPGKAPEWQWNQTLAKFAPMPAERGGTYWKRGFSIPLATGPGPDNYLVWEQAQAGAWQGFVALIGLLKAADAPRGKLPVVRCVGHERIEGKKGITFAPKFEIIKWVDRPAALAAGAGIDAPAAAEKQLDDDIPF